MPEFVANRAVPNLLVTIIITFSVLNILFASSLLSPIVFNVSLFEFNC